MNYVCSPLTYVHWLKRRGILTSQAGGEEEWDKWSSLCCGLLQGYLVLLQADFTARRDEDARYMLEHVCTLGRLHDLRCADHVRRTRAGTLKPSVSPMAFNPARRTSPLQNAVLQVLEALPRAPQLWGRVLQQLCVFVAGSDVECEWVAVEHLRLLPSLQAYPKFALQALLSLSRVYAAAPAQVRAVELERVLDALQRVLRVASTASRSSAGSSNGKSGSSSSSGGLFETLLADGIQAYTRVVGTGLHALAAYPLQDEQAASVWSSVADTLAGFLEKPKRPAYMSAPVILSSKAAAPGWEAAQLKLVECLVADVLPHSVRAAPEQQWRLLNMLSAEHLKHSEAAKPADQQQVSKGVFFHWVAT